MTDKPDAIPLGRVVGLWRYPVKSMAAEALDTVDVAWHGLQGDRRWAFIRNDSESSPFPWFTLRERNDMAHYVPSIADPNQADTSAISVAAPSGETYDIADPALGLSLCPEGARVIKQGRGVFDTFPLSLITTQTVAKLGEMVGHELDALRFRPNILVEAEEDTPFLEDSWVGRTLQIGGLQMRVDQRDTRCVVITIDPETGERNPAVLRAVAQEREQCLGVYGSTVTPARISLGDKVAVSVTAL